MWQSSQPASFSPAGLTLWPNRFEHWLATLSMLSTQVQISVGLPVPGRYTLYIENDVWMGEHLVNTYVFMSIYLHNYFPSCEANRKINIKLIFKSVHKHLVLTVYTSFHFPYKTRWNHKWEKKSNSDTSNMYLACSVMVGWSYHSALYNWTVMKRAHEKWHLSCKILVIFMAIFMVSHIKRLVTLTVVNQ